MGTLSGKLISINLSSEKGVTKKPVQSAELIADHGLEGDAHAGDWHRQVSLLAQRSIDKMLAAGLDVGPGDFAENLTVDGFELHTLPLGTRLRLGPALLELTQIGKVCHARCAIYEQAGDCVMPREGIFVKVLTSGTIKVGDTLELL
ncbi:MAG: MOSC domain-containing protein [Candidatus Alcyoniella australis]|nr:MOSC domain-containing protein [Candidatus Alcyoniella australis]